MTSPSEPNQSLDAKFGPPLRIPWMMVLSAFTAAGVLTAVAWGFLAPLWGWESWSMAVRAFLAVVPIAIFGWVITLPWRPRPAVDWITIWLAGTVVRLLATPVLCLAIYSRTPCDSREFVAAVGAVYFVVLMTEVGAIAANLPRGVVGDARQEKPRL